MDRTVSDSLKKQLLCEHLVALKFESSPIRAELDEKSVQKSLGTSRVIAK